MLPGSSTAATQFYAHAQAHQNDARCRQPRCASTLPALRGGWLCCALEPETVRLGDLKAADRGTVPVKEGPLTAALYYGGLAGCLSSTIPTAAPMGYRV